MEKVLEKKQLKVITDNKVGMLAEIAGLIAEKGVNIENFCVYACCDKSVFLLLTSDNEKAKNALIGKGHQIEEMDVILLQLWNRSGTLASVVSKLRPHGINLEYVYGTSSQSGDSMTVVFSSNNNDKASEVFTDIIIEDE